MGLSLHHQFSEKFVHLCDIDAEILDSENGNISTVPLKHCISVGVKNVQSSFELVFNSTIKAQWHQFVNSAVGWINTDGHAILQVKSYLYLQQVALFLRPFRSCEYLRF